MNMGISRVGSTVVALTAIVTLAASAESDFDFFLLARYVETYMNRYTVFFIYMRPLFVHSFTHGFMHVLQ
jgi:hypothetical protein